MLLEWRQEADMYVLEHHERGVAVLTVHGDIVIGAVGPSLTEIVRRLLDGGDRRVLLDITRVRYVDSGGLGELVRCHSAVTHRGGGLRLCGVSTRVRELLAITRLLPVFECADSVEAGLAGFAAVIPVLRHVRPQH